MICSKILGLQSVQLPTAPKLHWLVSPAQPTPQILSTAVFPAFRINAKKLDYFISCTSGPFEEKEKGHKRCIDDFNQRNYESLIGGLKLVDKEMDGNL